QGLQGYSDYLVIQGAMGRILERMNTMFRRQDFELPNPDQTLDQKRTVGMLLSKFDAIFTLNQDLLLEIHYFDKRRFTPSGPIGVLPGMAATGAADQTPWSGSDWVPSTDFSIPNNHQPYFKLHGSTNWRDASGSEIMILGGGKDSAIHASPVLRRYQEIFGEYLKRPGTRLTVIGYSFSDAHIDALLKEAVENAGLKMYVIDPQGATLAFNKRPYGPNQIGPRFTEFEEWFQKGLYSTSTIPLRLLLRDESLDREWLDQFLGGKLGRS